MEKHPEKNGLTPSYFAMAAAGRRRIALFAAVLIALFIASFAVGRYGVSVGQLLRLFLSRIVPIEATWDPNAETAVFNIRLPRILLACLVGCSLSAAGASMQGVFQNPMASPDILGASGGAAFGAALAIVLSAPGSLVTLSAFFFSLLSVAAVFIISRRAQGKRVLTLVLTGMVVGALFSAGTSLMKLIADPTNQLPAITYWLMGSLAGVRLKTVSLAAIPMALGLVPLLLLRWRMNILTLGDDEARSMGVNARVLRLAVIVCASLITAASVSVSGVIGWVGLMMPHIARRLVGSDYRRLLPASMLLGASFLLLMDGLARTVSQTELPIGILTAFIGAPFFLYLVTRRESRL